MMQIEQLLQMESDKLELSGLFQERRLEPVKDLLRYLYTAVDIWMLLSSDEKRSVRNFNEFFEKTLVVKLFLKELKSKKNKEKTFPTTHRKDNNKKEKSQKTERDIKGVPALSLEERKKLFHEECHKFDAKYGVDMVDDFYVHWSEEDEERQMMKFEFEDTWKTDKRLFKWSKDPITNTKKLVRMKLKNAEKKTAKAAVNTSEQKAAAAEREAADAQREEATAKAKADSITMEEYLKKNPNSILRTLKKHD
jgi:hypothetical protein